MAANPTTEKRAKEERARKVTAYDLVIGILAIFSLRQVGVFSQGWRLA